MGAAEQLEHAHHVAHGGGHDTGPLSMRVGITMAILGVILAFAAAKVGGERTELVQALVDQQHANANYQAQDVKHRVAILALQNLHAEAEVGKTNAKDMLGMALSAERYEKEAEIAKRWVDAFDPMIETISESQEHYERGQLAAEFGIVIASIALLLKRREPWFLAMALGLLSVVLIFMTWQHAHATVHEAEENVASAETAFDTARAANKTSAIDQALIDEVKRDYGSAAAPTK
jgi:type II secretory pathway pseudopilin PulG